MSWESELVRALLAFIEQYGYLGVFVFMFLETSLLFPFLPSEVVVPVAAALLVETPADVVLFAAVSAAGATTGSLVAYYAFGRTGAAVIERYGRYVRVSPAEIDRSQRWFRRWGESTVFWGRLLPVVRSLISIPAGFARMPVERFVLYTAAGSFLFNLAVAALVYYGSRQPLYGALEETTVRLLGDGIELITRRPAIGAGVVILLFVLAARWRLDR
jgi:membrane protein DedA with SNARE-associated domain